MLKIEVAHQGPCEEPCQEMGDMGHFQAFNSRATNSGSSICLIIIFLYMLFFSGMCIYDFFRCSSKMMGHGMGHSKIQKCCQMRFNKCSRGQRCRRILASNRFIVVMQVIWFLFYLEYISQLYFKTPFTYSIIYFTSSQFIQMMYQSCPSGNFQCGARN